MSARLALVAAAVCTALAVASLGDAAAADLQVVPIRAVILVDESGSLDPAAVANERTAAALLAIGELSPQSQFALAGFGSSNGPGQNAVEPYCDFITLGDRVARERFVDCTERVHRRAPDEGNDTDHAAALAQAVSQLANTPESMTPVIFLMTDGVLDVARSPSYGRLPGARNRVAMERIGTQILPQAKEAGIQVWALGFGQQVSEPALDAFARGGAGANRRCEGASGARPDGIVVGSSTDVVFGLLRTLGRARCAQVERPETGRVERGKTLTLNVRIPVIATDGAITVSKIDPSFRVAYFDPQGRQAPARGTLAGQTFELSGSNGNVEALRIQDPIPGTWKIKVTNPAGRPGQTVSATAVWQGALQGAISIVPGRPQPNEAATVLVSLLTRNGLVRDPSALSGVRATASVRGSFGELAVPLRDDGNAPDDDGGDGVFAGTLTLPSGAEGNATAVGRITGVGLAADERPYYFRIGGAGATIVVEFDAPETVHPGDEVSGKIDATNDGAAQTGSIQLVDVTNGAQMTIAPTSFPIPAGHTVTDFKVQFASRTPKGETAFRVRVTDGEGTRNDVVAGVRVTTPPSFVSRFWWLLPLLALLLAGAGILWYLREKKRKEAAWVRDLVAHLQLRGQEVSTLHAPRNRAVEFPIEVIDDDDSPRIRLGSNGQSTLVVKRAGPGFVLEGPNQPPVEGRFGAEIPINERLGLVVRDRRFATGTTPTRQPTGGPTGAGLVEPPTKHDDEDVLL